MKANRRVGEGRHAPVLVEAYALTRRPRSLTVSSAVARSPTRLRL